jgi:hypothetical protein
MSYIKFVTRCIGCVLREQVHQLEQPMGMDVVRIITPCQKVQMSEAGTPAISGANDAIVPRGYQCASPTLTHSPAIGALLLNNLINAFQARVNTPHQEK